MSYKKIAQLTIPYAEPLAYDKADEPFVDVAAYSDGKIAVDMKYAQQGRNGAITTAYTRRQVADMLLQANALLPDGCRLKIYDAWRPYDVQKELYDEYFDKLKRELPNLSEEQLHTLAKKFVSFPDQSKPFAYPHSSGGAVDLTIIDAQGNELDMGTGFDDFTALAETAALEHAEDSAACQNRRLLYHVMTSVGFTNYPSEWWHFDYADTFWGRVTGLPVRYGSVYTVDQLHLEER